MTTRATTCPSCGAPQDEGLLCHNDTLRLEIELGDVAAIVDDLNTTLSRQSRMSAGGRGGLASEKNPIHIGAMHAAGVLENVLGTWAMDLTGEAWWPDGVRSRSVQAARVLLSEIPAIRRHPAADEIVDQIVDAVGQARHAVDLAANRTIIFVGPCPELDEEGVTCPGEVHAFIPTEDDRPARMECGAEPTHRWGSVQWYRTGKRILDTIEKRKRSA